MCGPLVFVSACNPRTNPKCDTTSEGDRACLDKLKYVNNYVCISELLLTSWKHDEKGNKHTHT